MDTIHVTVLRGRDPWDLGQPWVLNFIFLARKHCYSQRNHKSSLMLELAPFQMQVLVELNNLYLKSLLFCFVLWSIISEGLHLICLADWVCSVVILVETGSHSVAMASLEYHVSKATLEYVDAWLASPCSRVTSMNLHTRLQLSS